jgi:hypothetical protein
MQRQTKGQYTSNGYDKITNHTPHVPEMIGSSHRKHGIVRSMHGDKGQAPGACCAFRTKSVGYGLAGVAEIWDCTGYNSTD